MLFYIDGLYKTYNSLYEAIRAWMMDPPKWKRHEGAATSSSLDPKYGHEDNHYMYDTSSALLICFVIGYLTS